MRSFIWELENNTNMHSKKLKKRYRWATGRMRKDNIKMATNHLPFSVCVCVCVCVCT
jgi:hypothetical protein